jgi:hypothetical protein
MHARRRLVEKRRWLAPALDSSDAICQIARFDQSRIHAVHADRRGLVRGVPREPDASLREAIGQARVSARLARPS